MGKNIEFKEGVIKMKELQYVRTDRNGTMKYYINKLVDKQTGKIIKNQKGYTKDIEMAKARFSKQNMGKGIYAVVDIEEISEEKFKSLPKHWN